MLVLCTGAVLALNFKTTFNPFTNTLDYYIDTDNLEGNLNLTGYTVYASAYYIDERDIMDVFEVKGTAEYIFDLRNNPHHMVIWDLTGTSGDKEFKVYDADVIILGDEVQ